MLKSDPESVSGTDPHQQLNISSNWWAQSLHQVSMKLTHYFFSNPANRMTDRQTGKIKDHETSALLAEVTKVFRA